MRALADLIEQPRGEDADEEHDPERRVLFSQPLSERRPDRDAERNARRRAEPGRERSFRVGEREKKAGDAADQACAGLTAQHADDDGSADADDGERAAAKIETQITSDGLRAPHEVIVPRL